MCSGSKVRLSLTSESGLRKITFQISGNSTQAEWFCFSSVSKKQVIIGNIACIVHALEPVFAGAGQKSRLPVGSAWQLG